MACKPDDVVMGWSRGGLLIAARSQGGEAGGTDTARRGRLRLGSPLYPLNMAPSQAYLRIRDNVDNYQWAANHVHLERRVGK